VVFQIQDTEYNQDCFQNFIAPKAVRLLYQY